MAITTYNCLELEGTNGDRILSVIDPQLLHDGDRALVFIDTGVQVEILFFEYILASVTATNTTAHPYSVRPNNYGGSGVWHERPVSSAMTVLYGLTEPPSPAGLRDGTLYLKYE